MAAAQLAFFLQRHFFISLPTTKNSIDHLGKVVEWLKRDIANFLEVNPRRFKSFLSFIMFCWLLAWVGKGGSKLRSKEGS